VRHAFTKHGGNLGTDGSVAYMFNKKGIISYGPGADEDAIMEAALEAGAEDVSGNDDGSVDVYATPDDFSDVVAAMRSAGFEPDNAEVTFEADTNTPLDRDGAEKLLRLVDFLEDLDDVQEVYTNADIASEIMEALDA
jgi:transcriptional/translational regulatory protein YebC/TACO1